MQSRLPCMIFTPMVGIPPVQRLGSCGAPAPVQSRVAAACSAAVVNSSIYIYSPHSMSGPATCATCATCSSDEARCSFRHSPWPPPNGQYVWWDNHGWAWLHCSIAHMYTYIQTRWPGLSTGYTCVRLSIRRGQLVLQGLHRANG